MTILLKRKPRYINLLSSEDVILSDFLVANGITNGAVVITIPAGEIIGGTIIDGYALNIGNISGYTSIELIVAGEIQGKGGNNTTGNLDGQNALYSARALTVTVEPTGAIRGGGGGGATGKTGPTTSSTSWGAEEYVFENTYWRNPTRIKPDELVIGWHGAITQYLGVGVVSQYGSYRRGSLKISNSTDGSWKDEWYAIQKQVTTTVAGAAGGIGGVGQGYNQEATLGTPSSGNGETGGDGGDWGLAGENTSAGSGGIPGYAINTLEGPVTGLIVVNNGLIEGPVYY